MRNSSCPHMYHTNDSWARLCSLIESIEQMYSTTTICILTCNSETTLLSFSTKWNVFSPNNIPQTIQILTEECNWTDVRFPDVPSKKCNWYISNTDKYIYIGFISNKVGIFRRHRQETWTLKIEICLNLVIILNWDLIISVLCLDLAAQVQYRRIVYAS